MNNDIEPLMDLDKAIQSLKTAGYEFTRHTIVDTETAGNHKDFHKRVIELRCCKYFPISENGEVSGVRKFTSFANSST